MMDVKTTLASGLTDGLSFEQALEIHRLHQESFLTATQIANLTGIGLSMVSGVLTGRYFPGAARQWERKQ